MLRARPDAVAVGAERLAPERPDGAHAAGQKFGPIALPPNA
jgi:hypothetical protein